MITATIGDLSRYKRLGVNLDRAIDWIQQGTWKSHAEDGKLAIDGDRVFALFMSYETKRSSEALFETHRRYIDIQMLLEGIEHVEVADATGLEIAVPYVEDIEFQQVPSDPPHTVVLRPGVAVVLFPEDAHRPSLAIDDVPKPCRKVVLKVLV